MDGWSDTSTIDIIILIPLRGSDKLDPHTSHPKLQLEIIII